MIIIEARGREGGNPSLPFLTTSLFAILVHWKVIFLYRVIRKFILT